MIDNKKEQERDELHRTIWNMANDLRGSVDGWDFKQYVLGMLFYRYISENFIKFVNAGELEAGNKDFDYSKLDDEDAEEAREDLMKNVPKLRTILQIIFLYLLRQMDLSETIRREALTLEQFGELADRFRQL